MTECGSTLAAKGLVHIRSPYNLSIGQKLGKKGCRFLRIFTYTDDGLF